MWNRNNTIAAAGSTAGEQVEALRQRISELESRLHRYRQTEAQLLESEQHYKALLDLNFDPVITVGRDTRIITANPAAARLSGYSVEELRGMPISRLCAPALLPAALQGLNRALLGDPQDVETALITKDGRQIPVYCTGGPLLAGGRAIGLFVVARDLSLQKHTAELLRNARAESEQRFQEQTLRYRQLFECSADAVLCGDVADYVFEEANPAAAALLGYSPAELIGLSVLQISAEPNKSQAGQKRMLQGPTPQRLRFQRSVRRKDGRVLLVDVFLGSFFVNGRVKFTAAFRDISERLQLEREILDIGQREQRRLGLDLEEGICEQLSGIALLGRDLVARLQSPGNEAGPNAQKLVELVEATLAEARALVHGLQPVDLKAETLVPALRELAARVERVFGIPCEFQHDMAPALPEDQAARQFYLIAQEALSHTARHQRAQQLRLQLQTREGQTVLTVRGTGCDSRATPPDVTDMAHRIMQYRAELIGAAFDASPAMADGSTVVTCSLRSNP